MDNDVGLVMKQHKSCRLYIVTVEQVLTLTVISWSSFSSQQYT